MDGNVYHAEYRHPRISWGKPQDYLANGHRRPACAYSAIEKNPRRTIKNSSLRNSVGASTDPTKSQSNGNKWLLNQTSEIFKKTPLLRASRQISEVFAPKNRNEKIHH